MPKLNLYTIAPSITLLMPFAGVGQSFRLYAPSYSSPVTHFGRRCRGPYSPVKRGQKDCDEDHAVHCQDHLKATGLRVNPG
jgi:hypothetical protein